MDREREAGGSTLRLRRVHNALVRDYWFFLVVAGSGAGNGSFPSFFVAVDLLVGAGAASDSCPVDGSAARGAEDAESPTLSLIVSCVAVAADLLFLAGSDGCFFLRQSEMMRGPTLSPVALL